MNPYLPFAALPIAVVAAWFSASHWSDSDPGRYQIPAVAQIEDPSVPMEVRSQPAKKPDIRVKAFLPHIPPKPPVPEPTLVLYSVMTTTDVRLATINGQVVKEGDRVERYLVQRIAADGVELTDGSRTRRLPMRPLHELPAPVQPGEDVVAQRSKTDLTQNFWEIFDSLKP